MAPDAFRRYHLADWPVSPWAQLAHETWEEYDREATRREDWWGPRGRYHAPRMNEWGLPPEARGGFANLFLWMCREKYETAQGLGFIGTFHDWRQRVRDAGRLAPT